MIVVADDFTGAAEIAAASFHRGFSSAVLRDPLPENSIVRHTVLDTDSRLSDPSDAQAAISRAIRFISRQPKQGLFKKVDSVLRGNLGVEFATLATALHKRRILLHPANPSTGRSIWDRTYRINGTPISETEFAIDPTHPAMSDDPVRLLGDVPGFQVHCCKHHEHLPETGLIICEASTADDVKAWSKKLLPSDLPAGGREFYESIIENERPLPQDRRSSPSLPPQATLLIHGTVSRQRDEFHRSLKRPARARLALSPAANEASALAKACEAIIATLRKTSLATLEFERLPTAPANAAQEIERVLQALLAKLKEHSSLLSNRLHLILEGGATAALVMKQLGINELQVERIWAGGVVSLATPSYEALSITTKPGSYPWPPALVASLPNQATQLPATTL
ncbi:four-carbon acid sugar kinase family protein [Pelagicoccus sp. SDUM812005]|uniref:four-carbon acid sugar kinase family protein n=1 Tax=Pelagicoccus sp. SDUM812005 TaxID=3041257 RepID=UPI00280EE9C0|nr:four-carbon acid sugar kinase family protein [Pelagicoccus sp. SDUM812005]MDQ8179394.1 four-carbon acid sugar kinase family protein [Pelagicoccus sp. SDUM812005]